MSTYKCTRCPYTTVSHWLLREHELDRHVNDIKIDPKNPKAPTTVSFGPDVAKAPTKILVSRSGAVQHGYGVDDVYMSSDTGSDTEDESESVTEDEDESDTEDLFNENQDLLEIINDIKSTFNYGLQLRKIFREKIENMEEYDQDEWKKILKSYAKLEASVKDEIEGLDSTDKSEEDKEEVKEEDKEEGDDHEEKEDFWDFIKEFKHVLNEKDLKMVEKYFDKEAEKKMDSKIVEDDEGIENVKMVTEKVDELKDDFHEHGSDCFKHCSEEKIHCVASAVNSLLRLGSTVMNPQKAKFLRELMLPYHETVRKIGNPKVSTHEKRKLLQKAQVGEGVLNSVTDYFAGLSS